MKRASLTAKACGTATGSRSELERRSLETYSFMQRRHSPETYARGMRHACQDAKLEHAFSILLLPSCSHHVTAAFAFGRAVQALLGDWYCLYCPNVSLRRIKCADHLSSQTVDKTVKDAARCAHTTYHSGPTSSSNGS